jgi:uncharacterized protein (DUF58 family)
VLNILKNGGIKEMVKRLSKKFRGVIAVLLVAVLALGLFGVFSLTASTAQFTVFIDSVDGSAGDVVTVPLMVENNKSLSMMVVQ